jgi:hypothetical protein
VNQHEPHTLVEREKHDHSLASVGMRTPNRHLAATFRQRLMAKAEMDRLGFEVTAPSVEGAFVRIYALKNAENPDAKLVLPFRGATGAT